MNQAELKRLLSYDPDTGVFTWLVDRSNKVRVGHRAGVVNKRGYSVITINYTQHRAHRLAWLYVHGRFPENNLDHVNRDKTDNRLCNLREATSTENNRNMPRKKANTSGVNGVHWSKSSRKWHAQISILGKTTHLGLFDDIKDAALMRWIAERRYGYHSNHGQLDIVG